MREEEVCNLCDVLGPGPSGWGEGPHYLSTLYRGFAAQEAVKTSREFSEPGPRLTALSRLTLVIASKASDRAGPVLLPTREIF